MLWLQVVHSVVLPLKALLAGKAVDPARLAMEVALLADKLDIAEECTRLRAHLKKLEADFDSVLYRFTEVEGESATCVSREEDACDDDGGAGTDSLLDQQLEAGVHYFIVDGFGKRNDGSYTLAVTVE